MYVRSYEESVCPICGGRLRCVGSRLRRYYNSRGEKEKLVIRRLQCSVCHRIHHELPDMLVPYKRYSAEVIERIISRGPGGGVAGYPCEDSTARRLHSWFLDHLDIFQNTLESIKYLHNNDPDINRTINQLLPLRKFPGFPDGWLKALVRLLVNTKRWPQTRFA